MNNTTSSICPSILNYNSAIHISYIIWRICGLLCILFGIPGHVFSIIITTNKVYRKQPVSLYFIAIAICELIFLFGVSWLWCVDMSLIKIDPRQIFSCGIFYSLLIGPTILSNLYLASMSIDRSVMILYPARYRALITRRHVLIRICVILIIIIIVMIPHHFYYYYDKKTTLFLCEFHDFIDRWRIRLWPFIHAILFVSIPSLITYISSIILIHNRCKHRRVTKNHLSENARRIERNSILILFVTIAISFSIFPHVILEIFTVHDRLYNHDQYCSTRWKTYKILLNWFLTLGALNYSFKFYIRLVISKIFRKDFLQLIACLALRRIKTNEQQIIPLKTRTIQI
ncbi:hypothetical protein I4U23_012509 [Adineta vaga]|nr:hypothetical protein I4U23_012509 [Adineta vaga]